jgi:hypothetical protein
MTTTELHLEAKTLMDDIRDYWGNWNDVSYDYIYNACVNFIEQMAWDYDQLCKPRCKIHRTDYLCFIMKIGGLIGQASKRKQSLEEFMSQFEHELRTAKLPEC